MGLVMRWYGVQSIPGVTYSFFRQGHSHVAFLGWGYLAIIVLMIEQFLPKERILCPRYQWNLIFTTIFIAGMIFSFPLLGYKTISIVLLSLFLVTSVVFVVYFLKDYSKVEKRGISHYFLAAAFVWYLLSGVGPFALGPIVVFYGKGDLYHLAVYYYLHFLYNGFFVFGIGALFFRLLEQRGVAYSVKKAKYFFWLSASACLPAYALSTLWIEVPFLVVAIAFLAALLQIISIVYLISLVKGIELGLDFWVKGLLKTVLSVYVVKLVFQLLSAIPSLSVMVYEAKSFVVVGYIHLVTLGLISLFLLSWLLLSSSFSMKSRIARLGLSLFLSGFLATEALLFLRGLFQWLAYTGFESFFLWLAIFSSLMPLGIFLFLIGQIIKGRNNRSFPAK